MLYAQNPDKQLAMASTTKIMTALLTLEQPDLYTYFTVDSNAIPVSYTHLINFVSEQNARRISTGMLNDMPVSYTHLACGFLCAVHPACGTDRAPHSTKCQSLCAQRQPDFGGAGKNQAVSD